MYKEKGEKAIMEIYRRMYKESEPSADIDKIISSGEGKKPKFFMKYYLDAERQQKIIDEVCKELKVNKVLKRQIEVEVNLGSSPTSSKEAWERSK